MTLTNPDSSKHKVQAGSGDAVLHYAITQRQRYSRYLCVPITSIPTWLAWGGVLWNSLVWHGTHIFMQVSPVLLPRDSVSALWKVKEMHFNPQLSVRLGKTLLLWWYQAREGKAPVEKRVAWPLHGLIKTLQYLASGEGMGWDGMGKDSPPFLHLSGRQGHIEQEILPTNPSPSQPPSTLHCSGSGVQEQRQHAAKEEKTENTAGNRKGNQKYWVIFFFFIKCTERTYTLWGKSETSL